MAASGGDNPGGHSEEGLSLRQCPKCRSSFSQTSSFFDHLRIGCLQMMGVTEEEFKRQFKARQVGQLIERIDF